MSATLFDAIAVLVFGAIIGSFLNVVILRLKTGRSIVSGRSVCFSCGKILSWFEMIPIVSYMVLRGKCSRCRTEVSFQYPVVEWGTALLFLISFFAVSPQQVSDFSTLLFLWLQIAFLIIISGYDIRHHIIAHQPLILLFGVTLLQTVTSSTSIGALLVSLMYQVGTGILLALPFYGLWRFSKGTWMGLGDGKLVFVIGFMLPGISGLSAILFAFYTGALIAVSMMMAQRIQRFFVNKSKNVALTLKSELPFGPFLAFGTVVVALYEVGAVWLAPYLPLLIFYAP